jgi:hypothetical protein
MYRIIGADGREYGPISADQLRQWIAENRANAASRVQAEGSTEWKPLGSIPEFSLLFASTSTPSGAPAVFPSSARTSVPANNGFAIAGLVLGIFSLTAGLCCCCYGMPFNVLGLICSIIALGQINANPNRYQGKGVAIAGLVLCIVSIVITVVLLIIFGITGSMDRWNQQMSHHGYKL